MLDLVKPTERRKTRGRSPGVGESAQSARQPSQQVTRVKSDLFQHSPAYLSQFNGVLCPLKQRVFLFPLSTHGESIRYSRYAIEGVLRLQKGFVQGTGHGVGGH